MPPPKLLDIRVETPQAKPTEAEVAAVRILDAGATEPRERTAFVHFYATAMAVLIERAAASAKW
jgi:hypothetical protein